VITWVNTALTFPQSSVAVHVFVYVPVGKQAATKAPVVLTIVKVLSQLSAPTGTRACAVARPAASLHSTALLKDPAAVVQVGTCVSTMLKVWLQVLSQPAGLVIEV
jgi:hypothetical protein